MSDNNQNGNDLHQLFDDVIKTASIVEVPCNEEAIWEILNAYPDFFAGSAVALRTTSHPKEKRDLSVRYLELEKPHDPYAVALERGFIDSEGHPIRQVIPEVQEKLPVQGYGVDFSVRHGLDKIWPFFRVALPMEQVYSLSSMPESVRNHEDYFAKYDLSLFSLFAVDYWGKTVNIYFMNKYPYLFPPDKIAGMIGDLGYTVPNDEILEMNAKTVVIYYTFSWDSPEVERLSFGMAAPAAQVPTHLHPIITQFVKETPIRAERRQFTYNTAYARHGDYYKIEADYTGTIGSVLGAAISTLP